jgi:hypothetical protein
MLMFTSVFSQETFNVKADKNGVYILDTEIEYVPKLGDSIKVEITDESSSIDVLNAAFDIEIKSFNNGMEGYYFLNNNKLHFHVFIPHVNEVPISIQLTIFNDEEVVVEIFKSIQ